MYRITFALLVTAALMSPASLPAAVIEASVSSSGCQSFSLSEVVDGVQLTITHDECEFEALPIGQTIPASGHCIAETCDPVDADACVTEAPFARPDNPSADPNFCRLALNAAAAGAHLYFDPLVFQGLILAGDDLTFDPPVIDPGPYNDGR